MLAMTDFHGIVEINTTSCGAPLLRLLKTHAPRMRIECLKPSGLYPSYLIPLSQIDLSHRSLSELNAPKTTGNASVRP